MFDGLIDKQKERVIRDTLTLDHALMAIEVALDRADESGNPILDKIEDFIRPNAKWYAQLMNDFLLAYALGERPVMHGAAGDTSDGVIRRTRRRLVRDAKQKYPDASRAERQEKVDQLSDNQIRDAIDQVHRQKAGVGFADRFGADPAGDVGDWLATAWGWILENWPTILKVLLSLLVSSDRTTAMKYEVREWLATSGDWCVQATDSNDDDAVHLTIFVGPDAKKRAEEYAMIKNNLQRKN